MRASHWLLLLRLLALVALGVSVALLVDYLQPKPAFCGGSSGCAELRESGAGTLMVFGLPVSLPMVGVAGFLTIFLLSLSPSTRVLVRGVKPLAYAMGVGALGLIGWQVALGSYCVLCMVVDGAALLLAACAFQLRGGRWVDAVLEQESDATFADTNDFAAGAQSIPGVWRDDSQVYDPPNPLVQPHPRDPVRLSRSAWFSLLLLFGTAPLFYAKVVPAGEVPASISELYEEKRPTFVEFFDFQCPHCRDLSPRLKALAAKSDAGFVLGYRPLPQSPASRIAARLAICAGEQGPEKEHEVASRFFQQMDFSESALRATAIEVVDPAALDACLASDRPDERIARDIARLDDAGFAGLPTTFIGDVMILGAEATAVYEDALRAVRAGDDREGLLPWQFWAVVFVLFAAIVWSGWGGPQKTKD